MDRFEDEPIRGDLTALRRRLAELAAEIEAWVAEAEQAVDREGLADGDPADRRTEQRG